MKELEKTAWKLEEIHGKHMAPQSRMEPDANETDILYTKLKRTPKAAEPGTSYSSGDDFQLTNAKKY